MLDLEDLKKKLDEALRKETNVTLAIWLIKKKKLDKRRTFHLRFIRIRNLRRVVSLRSIVYNKLLKIE